MVMGDARFGALLASVAGRVAGNVPLIVGVGLLVLALGDAVLVRISLARFQRARLILD
jgi:uncharacterized membrane protein